jgi:hypothetical protein
MSDFYHRTEVRDITGHCNSLLFNPDDFPDYRRLKRGSTCFVRYASKAYFSDLMTQVSRSSTGVGGGGGRGAACGVGGAKWVLATTCHCLRPQAGAVLLW